jgi:hypothetical protein
MHDTYDTYDTGGVLLRASDIKRKSPIKSILLLLYGILVVLFAYTVDIFDSLTVCGALAGLVTVQNPARGHVFWHGASAYAIYIWWYAMRIR